MSKLDKIQSEIKKQYEIPNTFMQMVSAYIAFDTKMRPQQSYKDEVLHIIRFFQNMVNKNPRLTNVMMDIDTLWG